MKRREYTGFCSARAGSSVVERRFYTSTLHGNFSSDGAQLAAGPRDLFQQCASSPARDRRTTNPSNSAEAARGSGAQPRKAALSVGWAFDSDGIKGFVRAQTRSKARMICARAYAETFGLTVLRALRGTRVRRAPEADHAPVTGTRPSSNPVGLVPNTWAPPSALSVAR